MVGPVGPFGLNSMFRARAFDCVRDLSDMVQERKRILRKLDFLNRLIDEICKISETLLASRDPRNKMTGARLDLLVSQILDEIRAMAEPDQPYSSLVKA
jgi:hypothetical protein